MELPRALAPWAPYLELFPRELAVALAPLVQRLDRAIGPLQAASHEGMGEPEGFSGLARRGTYERLLLSEWLLADEAPEEFVRRAAMSEHAFLELARREPAGARVSVALFDAGPSQLGSPRIAHLAALVVLARRAAAAGAQFLWAVLQRADCEFETEVSPASVQHLLEARTHREALPIELGAWRGRAKALSEAGGAASEIWIVGGKSVERLAPGGAAVLRIEEVLDPEVPELEAVTRDGGRSQRVTLPLPDDPTCARLLRDPFAAATPAPSVATGGLAPGSNLVWGYGGTKLLARGAGGSLIVYPVPNSPRAGAGRPRVFRPRSGNTPVAAGRLYKGIIAFTAANEGGSLRLEYLGGKSNRLSAWEELSIESAGRAPSLDAPLGQCYLQQGHGPAGLVSYEDDVVVQSGDRLVLVRLRGAHQPKPRAHIEAEGVAALASVAPGFAYVQRRNGGWMLCGMGPRGEREEKEMGRVPPGGRAFFGWGGQLQHPRFGLVATEQEDGSWQCLDRNGVHVFVPAHGKRVEGIVAQPDQKSPALVLLDADRKRLSVRGSDWVLQLPGGSSEITRVAVSPYGPMIAYSTRAGEVFVYSLVHEALVYHLVPEPAR